MSIERSDVLVVGASTAGLAVGTALRAGGFAGGVTLVGAEPGTPYRRPPVSKQLLGGSWTVRDCATTSAAELDEAGIDLLASTTAVGLDVARRVVRVRSGGETREAGFGTLVIATGSAPRLPFDVAGLDGVHVLRTTADAVALAAAAARTGAVTIVGAGLLGTEAAATLSAAGVAVTLVGRDDVPLSSIDPLVGTRLGRLQAEHGISWVGGARVAGVDAEAGAVRAVVLADGRRLPTRCLLVSVGCDPATGWLAGSGLRLDDGVGCDRYSRAADGIYAAGDVARWQHVDLGLALRLENQQNAIEHGTFVADTILGATAPYTPVPYGWTDQLGARLQLVGAVHAADSRAELADPAGDDAFAVVLGRAGRVVGGVGWNAAAAVRRVRRWVVEGRPWQDVEVRPDRERRAG